MSDHQEKFVEFYSDLIKQYERELRKRTIAAVLIGACYVTTIAMFLLLTFFNSNCAH